MNSIIYMLLYPLYLFYLCIIFFKNLLYNLNILSSKKIECAVISIGNISFGGTGKTPFTIALAKKLQSKNSVAILSRGYKRDSRGTILVTDGITNPKDWKNVGDEPYLISQKLSNIPVVVDENRNRGGRFLIKKFTPNIILLDDGFQHRKLYRDIDIVLFDASINGNINYWREPFGALNRADIFILSKSRDKKRLEAWEKRLSAFNKQTYIINNKIDNKLVGLKDTTIDKTQVKDKSVVTFSGIANNDSFNNTVQQLRCNIVGSISFKDHHCYRAKDLKNLEKKYNELRPDYLLTTEKDLIKLPPSEMPIYALAIRMDFSNEVVHNINSIVRLLE